MADPIAVPVGACRCPGTPHVDGDTVYLAPKMTIPMGIAAWHVVRNATDAADLEGRLANVYLHFGITGWTFVDRESPDVDPRPVRWDPDKAEDLIEKYLPLWEGGFTVAQAADGLYGEAIFFPLASARDQLRKSSQTGPTADSTPAPPDSGSTPQTPSVPSSRNGTAGKRSGARAR
jgi:hypothetical protein